MTCYSADSVLPSSLTAANCWHRNRDLASRVTSYDRTHVIYGRLDPDLSSRLGPRPSLTIINASSGPHDSMFMPRAPWRENAALLILLSAFHLLRRQLLVAASHVFSIVPRLMYLHGSSFLELSDREGQSITTSTPAAATPSSVCMHGVRGCSHDGTVG